MITQSNRLAVFLLSPLLLLLIPLIAMQFSDEVNWSVMDFVIMGGLLLSVGFIFEIVTRKVKKSDNKVIIGLIVLVIFLLIWAELAVGIFGTPFAGS